MPDSRQHRGLHPEDRSLFAEAALPDLRMAVRDLSWLLSQGYADKSALKLVGDRYALVARQRVAVARCACSDAALARRRAAGGAGDAGRHCWGGGVAGWVQRFDHG